MSANTLVFDCFRALRETVSSLDFGAGPTGQQVQVIFGGSDDRRLEYAWIYGQLFSPSSMEWVTFGPGSKGDDFIMVVELDTSAPHPTQEDAFDRLAAMVAVLDERLTSQRLPAVDGVPISGVTHWLVESVAPAFGPNPDGQGFGASARINIRVKARSR